MAPQVCTSQGRAPPGGGGGGGEVGSYQRVLQALAGRGVVTVPAIVEGEAGGGKRASWGGGRAYANVHQLRGGEHCPLRSTGGEGARKGAQATEGAHAGSGKGAIKKSFLFLWAGPEGGSSL